MYRLVFNEGFEEGFKRGCEETAKEIAGKMLLNEIPPEIIADCTGLSLKAVDRLSRRQSDEAKHKRVSGPIK